METQQHRPENLNLRAHQSAIEVCVYYKKIIRNLRQPGAAARQRLMSNEPINPDEQPIFDALLEAGVKPRGAYTAVRRVRELAAHNIVTLIESKFDAQKTQFDSLRAQFDSLRAQFDSLRAQFDSLEAQFDSQNAQFAFQFDAQKAQFDAIHRENAATRRWLAFGLSSLGIVLSGLAIMIAVLRFLD